MNTPQKEWEKTRQMGRLRYALLHGFSFTLLYMVLSAGWKYVVTKQLPAFDQRFLIHSLIAFALASIAYGTLVWGVQERYYKKDKSAGDQP